MDIFDATELRSICRSFDPKANIPPWKLETILDAARWAPSPENVQHHRWILTKDPELKQLLIENSQEISSCKIALTPAEEFIQRFWWAPQDARAGFLEKSTHPDLSRYIMDAEYILIPLANGCWYDSPVMLAPETFGAISAFMGMMNIWTAATALGVGLAFIHSPFLDPRRRMGIEEFLGVPRDWIALGAIALGMPKRFPYTLKPYKFPLESIVFDEYWGRPWKRVGFRDGEQLPHLNSRGMDALDAIYLRRSIRIYKKGEEGRVPNWKIEKLLEAARLCNCPGNFQPWRFLVIRDPELKQLIADAAWECARYIFGMVPWEMVSDRLWYISPASHPKIMEYTADGSLMRYNEQADVCIIPCINPNWSDIPLGMGNPLSGLMSLAMVVQSMWNYAPALGLGMGFNALPMVDPRRKRLIMDAVGIPRDWDCFACLAVGIPALPRMASPPRFPLECFVFDGYWGRAYKRLGFR